MHRRHRTAVFAIAFAYVWLHGGWPILLAAASVDALVRRSALLLGPTALGLVLGLVINPFFPENLSFYWEQIVQVAVLGRSDALVLIGGEWHPAVLSDLLLGNLSVFLPLLMGVAALAAAILTRQAARADAAPRPERLRDAAIACALALLFFLMTARQARHQEYFLPLALLAGVLVAETAFAAVDLRALAARSRVCWGRLSAPLLAAACVFLGLGAAYALHQPRLAYEARPVWTRFAGVSAWTRAHVPEGEVIFHTRWDDFPQFFYYDPDHRYIAGLDALFMHRKDPEKYWLWRDISEGRRREGLAGLIEEEFGARYVILRMEPGPLRARIKKDPSFERVYADGEADVWRIRGGR